MPAKDIYHNQVKNALIKEGWLITDDPLSVQFGGIDLYVDLGAEKLIAAKKDEQQIAVEIKSFQSASLTAEFHTAVGQFINYRIALENEELDYTLYLAVPVEIYNSYFQRQLPQTVIQRYHFKLVIYDIDTQEIVKWIN
ncbi:MAG: fatty-acid oxidation protein subunit alpha [Candidatus Parabeggiatoa sp. nov. 2]|nr:MAG: fatty-acid oxidation protein subunit alpha [Beggiatoa sp. 4572_84]RKZ47723.1 MAG: fatty-acid oxidation protein subunit alpha [Gammaproteobacteria bacterium]